jgi:hypothetical protein
MDDKYLMGPAKEVLMAMETYARELAKMSLVLQPSKTAAIHGSALARGPATGSAQDVARACKLHGIKLTAGYAVGGAPVGSSDYVHNELSALVERLTSHMGRVGDAIKHQTTAYAEAGAPAVRTSRLYKLVRWCLAPAMFSYHLRTAPVEETQLHAWRYDEEVFKIAMDLLGVPAGHDHINYDSPSAPAAGWCATAHTCTPRAADWASFQRRRQPATPGWATSSLLPTWWRRRWGRHSTRRNTGRPPCLTWTPCWLTPRRGHCACHN